MPLATWLSNRYGTIDGIAQSSSLNGIEVGTFSGSKASKHRGFVGFDLSAAPASGLAPSAGEEILAADLTMHIDTLSGAGGWAGTIERVTRADWFGYAQATWQQYKTAALWTTPGGDVDPALSVPLTSPAASLIDWTVPGLLALALDAIENRAGLLLLRLKQDTEDTTKILDFGKTQPPITATLTLTTGAAHLVDAPDPPSATIRTGASASAPSRPASAGRASQGARPASPHRS